MSMLILGINKLLPAKKMANNIVHEPWAGEPLIHPICNKEKNN